jgi:hypothetical protein
MSSNNKPQHDDDQRETRFTSYLPQSMITRLHVVSAHQGTPVKELIRQALDKSLPRVRVVEE